MLDPVLTEQHEQAINLIMSGLTDGEVAEQIGVTKQTINKWRNHNTAFIDALTIRRQLVREKYMEQFSKLIEKALDIIEENLQSDDPKVRLKTAQFVMRHSGLQGFARPSKEMTTEDKKSYEYRRNFLTTMRDENMARGWDMPPEKVSKFLKGEKF